MHNQNRVQNRITNKLRSGRGMTMAEMMVTVAIIIILSGVAFISITRFQVQMGQKERDATAKQLFIAAQNHLTMAKGEGYLKAVLKDDNTIDTSKYGTTLNDGSYAFVQSPGNTSYTSTNSSVMDLMLPSGSIDETVRTGGSYIIRYQPETATVLDVFYTTTGTGSRLDYDLKDADLSDLLTNYRGDSKEKRDSRKNFDGGAILGWYGGAGMNPVPISMEAPSISVDNGEVLKVTIKDNNNGLGTFFTLHIKGVDSGAEHVEGAGTTVGRWKSLGDGAYEFVIDDIESNNHFSNLSTTNETPFIAGEDLEIYATSENNAVAANLSNSETEVVNSLYQSIAKNEEKVGGKTVYTAFISTCRHLENLEEDISNTGVKTSGNDKAKKITLTAAVQTEDLNWDHDKVTNKNGIVVSQDRSGYWPVSCNTDLIYDGMRHSITGITTSGYTDAGLFGELKGSSAVKDLKLIDFSISGTTNAGALAGKTSSQNVKIQNIIAYHTKDKEDETIVTANTAAGGLIGDMNGGNMRYCGAALLVRGGRYAGGLIGTSGGSAKVIGCYAGGHTKNGKYESGDDDYNVIASGLNNLGDAGGLAGRGGQKTLFKYCYTTCSVKGYKTESTGGFIGTVSSPTIENCYAAGLVGGPEANNAFIGQTSGGTISNCGYYQLVNENATASRVSYRGPGRNTGITSIDGSAESFNSMVGSESTWNTAEPYDEFLRTHYRKGSGGITGYELQTTTQLRTVAKAYIEEDTADDASSKMFVNTHYGDWPAPEMLFVNNQ